MKYFTQIIDIFLEIPENAITFAKLSNTHDDFEETVIKLEMQYTENPILNVDFNSWQSIIETNCYF